MPPDDVTAAPTADAPAATTTVPVVEAPPPTLDAPPAAAPVLKSTGLGFEEFLAGKEGPKDLEPSPAAEDAKPADAEDGAEKKPPSPAKVDPPPKKDDTPPLAAKPGEWESEDNPHKKRADELEKRVKDTRDSFTKVTQELAALKKQGEVLGKKVDGTYDPEVDDKAPDPDTVAAEARQREVLDIKTKASKDAAYRIYGKEAVDAAIFAEGSPYSAIEEAEPDTHMHRVMAADSPVIAAMELLAEREFTGKWGSSPKDIESRIRADERALAEKEITERLEKKYADRSTKREAQVTGIADARGSGAPVGAKSNGALPLSAFGNPGLR